MVIRLIIFITSFIIFIGIPFASYLLSEEIIKILIRKKKLSVNKNKHIPLGKSVGIIKNEVEAFKSEMIWLKIILLIISIPIATITVKIFLYHAVNWL